MSNVIEQYAQQRAEAAAKAARQETKMDIARRIHATGKLSLKEIADVLDIPTAMVQEASGTTAV